MSSEIAEEYMKKYMIDLSADMSGMDNFYNLAKTFHDSAVRLYAYSCNGYINPRLPRELYDNNLVPAIYLFRHAVELMLKALLEEMSCFDNKDTNHNLQKLWKKCVASVTDPFVILNKEKIECTFAWFEEEFPGVLDDQLYRYPTTKRNEFLHKQGPIKTEGIEKFIALYNGIRSAVENIQGVKYRLANQQMDKIA